MGCNKICVYHTCQHRALFYQWSLRTEYRQNNYRVTISFLFIYKLIRSSPYTNSTVYSVKRHCHAFCFFIHVIWCYVHFCSLIIILVNQQWSESCLICWFPQFSRIVYIRSGFTYSCCRVEATDQQNLH